MVTAARKVYDQYHPDRINQRRAAAGEPLLKEGDPEWDAANAKMAEMNAAIDVLKIHYRGKTRPQASETGSQQTGQSQQTQAQPQPAPAQTAPQPEPQPTPQASTGGLDAYLKQYSADPDVLREYVDKGIAKGTLSFFGDPSDPQSMAKLEAFRDIAGQRGYEVSEPTFDAKAGTLDAEVRPRSQQSAPTPTPQPQPAPSPAVSKVREAAAEVVRQEGLNSPAVEALRQAETHLSQNAPVSTTVDKSGNETLSPSPAQRPPSPTAPAPAQQRPAEPPPPDLQLLSTGRAPPNLSPIGDTLSEPMQTNVSHGGQTPRDYGTLDAPNRHAIGQHFAEQFAAGKKYATINDARDEASQLLGGDVKPGTIAAKHVDEAVEIGVTQAAHDIIHQGRSDVQGTMDKLVDLYNRQPNLSVRTSTSMQQQAYSTPAPLAFGAGDGGHRAEDIGVRTDGGEWDAHHRRHAREGAGQRIEPRARGGVAGAGHPDDAERRDQLRPVEEGGRGDCQSPVRPRQGRAGAAVVAGTGPVHQDHTQPHVDGGWCHDRRSGSRHRPPCVAGDEGQRKGRADSRSQGSQRDGRHREAQGLPEPLHPPLLPALVRQLRRHRPLHRQRRSVRPARRSVPGGRDCH